MTVPVAAACPFCESDAGLPVFRSGLLRIVRVAEAGFPAFYRVIWNAHVAEFSDLSEPDRAVCMAAVVAVERALRHELPSAKINLAALGNMVPHLHWHVVARFAWDSHFPAPIWAAACRVPAAEKLAAVEARLPAINRLIAVHMGR